MDIWAILLFVIGLALLIIEMNIPGFGVAGSLGIIMLIVGVFLQSGSLLEAVLIIALLLVVIGAAFGFIMWRAATGRMTKSKLILKERFVKDAGYMSNEDLSALIGSEGNTTTALRPAGVAEIAGRKIDVVSEGEFIEAGSQVIVEKVEGRRVVVKKVN
ncbi:MAG: NfeD family protein [Christensenellales bacterium]|jgi:membrane-bound ClpP family serine protease